MHQHPGIVGRAAVGQRAGHGIGARGAAAGAPYGARSPGERVVDPAVAGCHRHAHLGDARVGEQGADRQPQHGLAAQRPVLLGHGVLPGRLARAPTPAAGTMAMIESDMVRRFYNLPPDVRFQPDARLPTSRHGGAARARDRHYAIRTEDRRTLCAAAPPSSGDAWLLADLARQAGGPLVILTAEPLEAQRLAEEIQLFAPNLSVRQLPDWETLPYDAFSPHQDLISERLHTLHALMTKSVDVLTVPVTTALYRLAPPSFLAAYTFSFKQKDRLDEAALRAQLTLANYNHVTQVTAPGEFCLRGGLIDLFPMGSVLPYRLDLFDDEIETIRSFDVDTQRSLYPVGEVRLLPGREFPMDEEARNRFRARFREVFEGDPSRALPYKDIGNGIPSPASNTTCRCSSTRPRRCSTIWPTTRSPSPWETSTTPCSASARIRPAGTAFSRATASARCCRRRRCSWTLKRCTAS